MRAHLIAIGGRMPRWVAEGFADYARRLSREFPLDLIEVKPGARGKGRSVARAIAGEGAALLTLLPRHGCAVALDGRGEPWTSAQLACRLAEWRMRGANLAFLVGGPDGHADVVLQRADECWSLGPLTLPHMLVRLVVAEQLYRAVTILNGHPYHRG